MFFILSNLLLLCAVLSLIFYRVLKDTLLPAFWGSKHARRFNQRISLAISGLFLDMRRDFLQQLTSLLEPDGDEPFEPYMDSPLRTCPPCEFISSSPKPGELLEFNNNTAPPPRTRQVAARRGGRVAQAQAQQARVRPVPVVRLPVPQPAVRDRLVRAAAPPRSPPPGQVVPPNLVQVERRMIRDRVQAALEEAGIRGRVRVQVNELPVQENRQ